MLPVMTKSRAAFTLIELLAAVAIIAVLVGLVFAVAPGMMKRGHATASLNNMRQLGSAAQMYASDNDLKLPRRLDGPNAGDKWPRLLHDYLKDLKVYADPGDKGNFLLTKRDPLNNGRNNTSYFMNGFNDVGAFRDDTVQVRINQMDSPSQTILMACNSGSGHFYMDFAEGNNNSILNKRAYGDGSNYMFADGSARFIREEDYDDSLWLVYKDGQIP